MAVESQEDKWKDRLQLTSPLYVGVEYYKAGTAGYAAPGKQIYNQKNWLQQNQNRINFSFIYKYMAQDGATPPNVKLVIENMSNILKPNGSDFKDDFPPVLTKLQEIFKVEDITKIDKVGGIIDMKLGRTIFFVNGDAAGGSGVAGR